MVETTISCKGLFDATGLKKTNPNILTGKKTGKVNPDTAAIKSIARVEIIFSTRRGITFINFIFFAKYVIYYMSGLI